MIVLYQSTFWLALALLAIVITVFVLAVSLLGRAIRISVEEQERVEQEKRKSSSEQITKLNSQLNEAAKKEGQPDIDSLKKNINDLQKQLRLANWRLRWICFKPKLLRVTWGALFPASLFVISIVTSSLAIYYDPTSHDIALSLWYTSIFFIILGIILIILTLTVTQDVAASTDEASFIRQKEMMKSALFEVEEAKKPSLILKFLNEQPPFDIVSNQEKVIDFFLHLDKGDIAVHPRVMFFVPEGFMFPGHSFYKQSLSVRIVGGLLSATINFERCAKAFDEINKITIVAPSEKDSYEAWYKVGCDSYDGELIPFKINVV